MLEVTMKKLEIFDPPMCCSTGVCGAEVDPVLPRFAADIEWLKAQGADVTRYNLAQQPGDFVANEAVRTALHEQGNACLPLILLDGLIVSRSAYPDRAALAGLAGIDADIFSAETVQPKRTLNVLPLAPKCC
jgi:arsenite methyltransferase